MRHFFRRQRVIRFDRGMTGRRHGNPLDGFLDGRSAVQPLEVLGQRAQRRLAIFGAQDRRIGRYEQCVATKLLDLEAKALEVRGACDEGLPRA